MNADSTSTLGTTDQVFRTSAIRCTFNSNTKNVVRGTRVRCDDPAASRLLLTAVITHSCGI